MTRNDFEHLVFIAPLSLANGLFYPLPTLTFLGTYSLGRFLFTTGYQEKEGAGNNKRKAGSLLCNAAHLGTYSLSLVLAMRLLRSVK